MSSTRKSQSDRSAETSGKILRAAQKLFALRGFDGVTMRAIASEAG
ncbi:MAG: helix-turn-helix domain-containing protein [Akkermansia sp.]